jgi:hypothetical protein
LQTWNKNAVPILENYDFFFKFLSQIFGFFSSKHEITTREPLSPQHSERVGSYGQFQF